MATKTARAWKATREAESGFFLDIDKVIMAGDNKHFLAADKNGVTIKGQLSIVAMSNEVRTGGLFIGPGEFSEMIPSTIVTPLPLKVPSIPTTAITNILQDVAFFSAFLV